MADENGQAAIQSLDWQKMAGLIPAIVQQADTGAVLMLGYMNEQALHLTQESGRVHFWSRSRAELWLKGEKSGNYLQVVSLVADCDGDALLVSVREATGSTPICHSGAASCFSQQVAVSNAAAPSSEPTSSAPIQHLLDVVERLMSPGGCPWDVAQTHESLKPNLLEETYEALAALDELGFADDIPHKRKLAKVADELGDVLLQVVMQAQIGKAAGEFTIEDIAQTVATKLVRRHPHVFADKQVSGVDEALQNWEEIKKQERGAEGGDKSLAAGLRGIPPTIPALHYAQQIQGRAKSNGYVWPAQADIMATIEAKLASISGAPDSRAALGELLWLIVMLGRSLSVNAEEALRMAAAQFVQQYRG